MWLELFVEYNGSSLLCEFMAYYTQSTSRDLIRVFKIKTETQKKLNLPEMPFIILESKEILKGEIEICKLIARLTGTYEVFFGKTKEDEEKNIQFIHQFNLSADYLNFLNNKVLQTSTFCNGNNITISDLYAFAFVIQEVIKLSTSGKRKFNNVLRWVDHIQNLKGLKEQLQRLNFIVNIEIFEDMLLINDKVYDSIKEDNISLESKLCNEEKLCNKDKQENNQNLQNNYNAKQNKKEHNQGKQEKHNNKQEKQNNKQDNHNNYEKQEKLPNWHPQSRNDGKVNMLTLDSITGNGKILLTGDSMLGRFRSRQEYLPDYIENIAIGGSLTQHWFYFIDNNIIPFDKLKNYEVIVIMLGTNNIHEKKVTPHLLFEAISEIIKKFKENLNNIKIVYVSMLNRYDKTKTLNNVKSNQVLLDQISETNSMISKIENISYLDLSKIIYEKEYYEDDLLHLNDKGYKIFADILLEFLKNL